MTEEIPLIKRELLTKIRRLGNGAFGTVYKAKYKSQLVALKIIIADSEKNVKSFINELNKIFTLRHPNIIELYGYCFVNLKTVSW